MSAIRNQSEVLQLLQDLVSIESHCEVPGQEAALGKFLVGWFRDHGIDASLQPVDGERANVVARIPGGDGPSLMFNGHMDTVPGGEMEHAFTPALRSGELRGRGACDMKGAIAAMAWAMVTLVNDGRAADLSGDLLFTGTVGEETGSIGVKSLIEADVRSDYAIVGEPTSLRVGIAHKGACFLRICLTGRGAHGSRPEDGVNAVSYAARIICELETSLRQCLALRTYPLLGMSTVSVGRIEGGTQPNIVAERCFIDIDRRTLPSEPHALDEIQGLVASICEGVPGLSGSVEEMPATSIVPHGALGTPEDAALVQMTGDVCDQLGLPRDPVGVTYWTDGGHLSACGIETLILGPGNIANAHGPNDRVAVTEIETSVALYRGIAERVLLSG